MENISQERLELLALLLQDESKEKISQSQTIPRCPRTAGTNSFPLSFTQERLWFLNQFDPESLAYNGSSAFRLEGVLNVGVLEKALNEIIRRHEVLRTTFVAVDGKPLQVIAPSLSVRLPVIDLQNLPEMERENEIQRRLTEKAQRPFDLANGPLIRVMLLQLGKAEHVFFLGIHHIVIDGWGVGVLIREMTTLYETFSTGKPLPLPELPVQYADFSVWQREWLLREELNIQLDYWKQELDGSPPLLELPTDRPRPAIQTFRGAKQRFELSQDLTEKLNALCRQERATLFMTLLAVFKVLLYRYSGQEDIVVGTPIANRNRSELQDLIGNFANTLVLRTDISGNPTFQEVLRRIRETALRAYAHQDVPFERLVGELKPIQTPFFQVMFILHNMPVEQVRLTDLRLTPLDVNQRIVQFDMTFSMMETNERLTGIIEYNTDLFDTATIERMVGHFETLLKRAIVAPEQRISEMSLLLPNEQRLLLKEWGDGRDRAVPDICIHELFEAQVQRTSEAIAVAHGEKRFTYLELNRRANQLAHYLQRLGVGPGTLVSLCLERSIEMVVGLLGILKAGGAYIPLDPAYPKERLAFMLRDSKAGILLTQQLLSDRVLQDSAHIVYIDTDWGKIAHESEQNLAIQLPVDNLAYIIYTSGSTGTPKGVMIEHRNVVNFLMGIAAKIPVTPEHTILAVTTISSDIFVLETLLPLTLGASIVIATECEQQDPHVLEELILKHHITIMQTTPSRLKLFVTGDRWEGLTRLKTLIVGGEAFPEALFHALKAHLSCRLYNVYGSTETTVWSTLKELTYKDRITIGTPIANTQVYIVDTYHQLVPRGMPGELCIGGDGVGRGYFCRPELTRERFVPNPFRPGELMYKTGDVVKWTAEGEIEFLGRIDQQVKIRGFRIEVGEIEHQLLQHEAIREVVVTARHDADGSSYLATYYVPVSSGVSPLATSELRAYLAKTLPEYMIPSYFVEMETFPLAPNGKIDRKALPDPRDTITLKTDYLPPTNELEEQLVALWEEVLRIDKDKISVNANFFGLGGHSLLVIQFCRVLKEKMDTNLPFRHFYDDPTIQGVCRFIARSEEPEKEKSLDDVNNALKHKFGDACVLTKYRVSELKQEFLVLFAEDTIQREVISYLKSHYSPRMQPHYIRTYDPIVFSRRNYGSSMNKIDLYQTLGLKKFPSKSHHEMEELIKETIYANAALNSEIKSKRIIDQYKCGYLQKVCIKNNYRNVVPLIIEVPHETDRDNIIRALHSILNLHSILRTVISKQQSKDIFIEYDHIDNLTFPIIDLSAFNFDVIQFAHERIVKLLMAQIADNTPYDKILFKIAILKLNETHINIIFCADHMILDKEGSNLLKESFFQCLNNKNSNNDLRKNLQYKDYVKLSTTLTTKNKISVTFLSFSYLIL